MKRVVIIGAGPAGIATAEKLSRQGIATTVFEKDTVVGGLSRTLCYRGNRFDVGPHRFFSKHRQVMGWWQEMLGEDLLRVKRHTRICYRDTFFNYPLSVKEALFKLGIGHCVPAFLSYIKARAASPKQEETFEQWVQNRFGNCLYRAFFKNYTEKIWGMPCGNIDADWAAQRIRGLSLSSALRNAIVKNNKDGVKSLIREFHYPRLGAGMMYEAAAARAQRQGANLVLGAEVVEVAHNHKRITHVICRNLLDGTLFEAEGTDFCSSMPLDLLIRRLKPSAPQEVLDASACLKYRSLLLVYYIVDQKEVFRDNWIYIHTPEVMVGRIQNYKNWSSDMIQNDEQTTLGLEYFCSESDSLWSLTDEEAIRLGESELIKLKLLKSGRIRDAFVVRVPYAYPVYEVNYRKHLKVIKDYAGTFGNLHCMGRSGMFRYNNMDHSVLTGFLAARNILGASEDIWNVNTEKVYYEYTSGGLEA